MLLIASLIALVFAPSDVAVQAYCWGAGQNPGFSAAPTVTQLGLDKVRVSWKNRVTMPECADNFLVKYWPQSAPNAYQITELVSNEADFVDIEVTPRLPYEFQAVAREDKGMIGGVDWYKSPVVRFATSKSRNSNHIVDEMPEKPLDERDGLVKPEWVVENSRRATTTEKETTTSSTLILGFRLEIFIGIVVLCLVFLFVLIGIVYTVCKKKTKHKDLEEQDDEDYDNDEDDDVEKEELAPDKNGS